MRKRDVATSLLGCVVLALLAWPVRAAEPIPLAAADFDHTDTSGKTGDQGAQQSGARLLLYGGIQKMSALIQYGKAQVVDLETDQLVFDRNISLRGDDDAAWDHAAEFLARELKQADLAKWRGRCIATSAAARTIPDHACSCSGVSLPARTARRG